MVRLRDRSLDNEDKQAYLFQFLHGAIKGHLAFGISRVVIKFQFLHGAIKGKAGFTRSLLCILFQFLHGAIKGKVQALVSESPIQISIPTWCD